ncbi:hypothetical protein ABIC78_003638 [Novosphingobium sp. 1529]|uniref:hypothetical protein n=1 Tax=Novosphingobium sp. 1529 TaxID=3156424 RepID=UPI003398DF65
MAKVFEVVMIICGLAISLLSMIPLYFYVLALVDALRRGGIQYYSIDLSREYNGVILLLSSMFFMIGIILFTAGIKRIRGCQRSNRGK